MKTYKVVVYVQAESAEQAEEFAADRFNMGGATDETTDVTGTTEDPWKLL